MTRKQYTARYFHIELEIVGGWVTLQVGELSPSAAVELRKQDLRELLSRIVEENNRRSPGDDLLAEVRTLSGMLEEQPESTVRVDYYPGNLQDNAPEWVVEEVVNALGVERHRVWGRLHH